MTGTPARFAAAALAAAALHLLIAAAFLTHFASVRENTDLPKLDLSAVELSFSDTPDDTAAPSAAPVTPPAAPSPPRTPPAPVARPVPPPAFTVPSGTMLPVRPKQPDVLVSALEPVRPDAPAPEHARIRSETPPTLRNQIRPHYPRGARVRGEEGSVTLELRISAQGLVDAVDILRSCGSGELEEAAVKAARLARFTPARDGETAVPALLRLTLTFRLND